MKSTEPKQSIVWQHEDFNLLLCCQGCRDGFVTANIGCLCASRILVAVQPLSELLSCLADVEHFSVGDERVQCICTLRTLGQSDFDTTRLDWLPKAATSEADGFQSLEGSEVVGHDA